MEARERNLFVRFRSSAGVYPRQIDGSTSQLAWLWPRYHSTYRPSDRSVTAVTSSPTVVT